MIRFVITIAGCLAAGPSVGAQCDLAGDEVIQEAKTKGFSFSATKSAGEGSCSPHKSSFLVTASESTSVTCQIAFFEKRSTRNGWLISDVWLSGSWAFARRPSGKADGSFVITATAEPYTTNTIFNTQLSHAP